MLVERDCYQEIHLIKKFMTRALQQTGELTNTTVAVAHMSA